MRRIMILVLAILIANFGFGIANFQIPNSHFAIRHPYQTEYEQMLYPTVRITAGMATGSGVIIDVTKVTTVTKVTGCYILTAAHVVDNQSVVNVELYNSTVITGTVVITDTVKDLALIKPQINTDYVDGIYTAKLAPKDYTYYLFTPVYAVGCSLGLPARPSSGILSALGVSAVEISAPILPGNSGGGVFTTNTHELIGIAVWVRVYQGQLVTTMAGVVPINQIYNFIEEVDSKQKTVDSKNH